VWNLILRGKMNHRSQDIATSNYGDKVEPSEPSEPIESYEDVQFHLDDLNLDD